MKDGKSLHHQGHRKRLKEKLQNTPSESSREHELLEMLLFYLNKRQDVKGLAHKLIKEFASLKNIIANNDNAHYQKLKQFNPNLPHMMLLIREVILNVLHAKIIKKDMLTNWQDMMDYLRIKFGHVTQEKFSIICLDASLHIIKIVTIFEGTIDEATIYTREIVKHALDLGATSIILVHNHFSGNVQPSKSDIELTERIVKSCSFINIQVIDHVIIAADNYFSFKENKII